MNKATINLHVKAVNEEQRLVEGWATTSDEDRDGDVVLPKGAVYKLPLPFLLDHDHRKVVGEVERVEVTSRGIKFWAHIKKIATPGEVKDMCDAAWELVRSGLRRSVSIGFRSLEAERIPDSRGALIKRWEWFELSAVGVPANAAAAITGFKSMDAGADFVSVQGSGRKNGGIPLITRELPKPAKPEGGAVRLIK